MEERLEVTKIEEQIEQAQTKLNDMMRRKTEESKSATKDTAAKLLEDYDTGTDISRINSKHFNVIEEWTVSGANVQMKSVQRVAELVSE